MINFYQVIFIEISIAPTPTPIVLEHSRKICILNFENFENDWYVCKSLLQPSKFSNVGNLAHI